MWRGKRESDKKEAKSVESTGMLEVSGASPELVQEDGEFSLHIPEIEQALREGLSYAIAAEGRNITLLVGRTGAGKTTLLNYLAGEEMEEEWVDDRLVMKVKSGEGVGRIGHTAEAETLYAQTLNLELGEKVFAFTDCPGFQSNTTKTRRVIESVSMELTISKASKIAGVVVVLSYSDLMDTKLNNLALLVKTLITLFKDCETMLWRSTIVITKSPWAKRKITPEEEEEYKREVRGTLGALLKYSISQQDRLSYLETDPNGLTREDYSKLEVCLQQLIILQNEFIYLNPRDKGQSRQLIIEDIIKPRPERSFYTKQLETNLFDQVKKGYHGTKEVLKGISSYFSSNSEYTSSSR